MIIDNFCQISRLLGSNEILKLHDPNEFYFAQIIQRSKDNNGIGPNNRLIKSYSLFELEHLADYEQEMISLCGEFNARAYIHITKRNSKAISLEMIKQLAEYVQIGKYHGTKNLYNSVCGKTFVKDAKTWVVDVDTHDEDIFIKVKHYIDAINTDAILARVLTKNGFHLITRPFNPGYLIYNTELISLDIDIHKNNPTILYVHDFEDNK